MSDQTTWERIKAALLCSWLGHRWEIQGLSGRYEWCKRCRLRREHHGGWSPQ